MLISTAELSEHLDDPEWVIFDCRHDLGDAGKGPALYAEGHIKGALFAAIDTDVSGLKTGRNGRHPLPAPDDFAEFLAENGVTADSQVVAYDDVGGQYAARLWWVARWIGLTRVAVLDGGWQKWNREGRPVDALVPKRARGGVEAKVEASMLAGVNEVEANLGTQDILVVDARAPERYRGEVEPLDPVAGHIPGAANRGFKLNLNDDLTMRSSAELRPEFEALMGGRRPNQLVHQCGSGITACVNLLAMEHAGLQGSKLYAGSWSEWCADPARPVSRG